MRGALWTKGTRRHRLQLARRLDQVFLLAQEEGPSHVRRLCKALKELWQRHAGVVEGERLDMLLGRHHADGGRSGHGRGQVHLDLTEVPGHEGGYGPFGPPPAPASAGPAGDLLHLMKKNARAAPSQRASL